MENLSQRLVDKSVEAFIMGLEIYNKPTIKYRIEGFSFFICNAWELMLKAEMLNRNLSIYFKDSPDRTLSLENVIKKIYSDDSTRIRLNLERIIELRNISTHYITEDYELKYAVVNDRLKKKNIKLNYKPGFNKYILTLIIDFYSIKSDQKFAYCHKIGRYEHYTYSQQFVDFIITEIEKDPQNFVESLKKSK